VSPDPKPEQATLYFLGKYSMVQTYPGGPEAVQFLELQRWMTIIGLKQQERFIGVPLDVGWQAPIAGPKLRGREMPHSSVERPAW